MSAQIIKQKDNYSLLPGLKIGSFESMQSAIGQTSSSMTRFNKVL